MFEEDDDDILYLLVCLLAFINQAAAVVGSIKERSPSLFEQRIMWEKIIERHAGRFPFKRHLRMEVESFNRLLSMIRPSLEVDEVQAARRGGAILPEICLYCTIRWLAGGNYSDIYMFAGISTAVLLYRMENN